MTASLSHARIVRARTLSPTVRELTLDAGTDFRFVPGQWISLRIPQPGGETVLRSYSIASFPRADHQFELAVTRIENGPGSTFLHDAAIGTTLPMTHAQGFFTLEPPLRPVVFVGTGTGVAPLRSMLLALAAGEERDVPTTLLFGVRHPEDVLYREEFEALARAWPAFRFEPTLSKPDAAWTGRVGWVQAHVEEIVRRQPTAPDVYICGLQRMVKDVRQILKDTVGLPRERIHSERYD